MNLFSIEEFTAKRTTSQAALEKALAPTVKRWLTDEETHLPDLINKVRDAYSDVYFGEGGTKRPTPGNFIRQVRAALRKGGEPDAHTVDRISVWLATAILNAATMNAVRHDPDELELVWVTMHDSKVRHAHAEADGQSRAPTEFYIIGGEKMRYPGDPSASIGLWINCRCGLRPTKARSVAASAGWGSPGIITYISEKPWDGSASRFTDQQWKSSCVMHVCDGMEKSCHKLPIKEPGGALSRAGVHAAAARINQTDGPAEAKARAKAALRGAYKQLGEEPPDAISASLEERREILAEQYGNTRMGKIEMGADMPDDEKVAEEVTEETEQSVPDMIPWHGVLAPEGVKSGDGRRFMENSLTFRPLPLPLTWQKASSDGHGGSVTVARIDRIWRVGNEMRADGVMLATPEADEVCGLMAEFGKYGVSVDADDAKMELNEEDESVDFSQARICSASIVSIPAFAEAWVALGPWDEADQPDPEEIIDETDAAASDEALVASGVAHLFKRGPGWITNPEDTRRLHDYWTKPGEEGYAKIAWGTPGDFNRCRVLVGEKIAENSPEDTRFLNQICAQWHHDALGFWPAEHKASVEREGTPAPALSLTASAATVYPAEHFADPGFYDGDPRLVTDQFGNTGCPLTITDDGRVFGHVAMWNSCHLGSAPGTCTSPPASLTDYSYFLLGEARTTEGPVGVGQIVIGSEHADDRLRAQAASAYYANTSRATADITVGEDEFGIWFSGSLRPGITEEEIAELRAAKISGDWRKIGHGMEMIAALAVNVPGFPIPRASLVASAGEQISLVASGIVKAEAKVEEAKIAFTPAEFAEMVVAAMEAREKKQKEREARIAALAEKVGV